MPPHRQCQGDARAGLTLLGGEPFEPENQRALLEAEGVAFLDDDTIDMRHHRWPPSDEPEQLTLGL